MMRFIFLFILISRLANTALQVDISAKAAVLMNAETGAILYEKNADLPLYPASITKVITALYALEKRGDRLDQMVEISKEAVSSVSPQARRDKLGAHPPYRLEFGGSLMGLKAAELVSAKDLFYGLMLSSGNDAANALAEWVSGNIPQFMEELNEYVKSLGCKQTTLTTPHGLTHTHHKTTAYDMCLLTKKALEQLFFCEVVKTINYLKPASNKQPQAELLQHNSLLKPGKFYYPKAIGVKTGYTASSGYTIVAAAADQNRKMIVVLMGCDKLEQRYRDTIALFEAGFNEPKIKRTLFSKNFDVFSTIQKKSKSPIKAILHEDVVIHYYASEEPLIKPELEWKPIAFPIQPGQRLATLSLYDQNSQVLDVYPLYAMEKVNSTFYYQILDKCLSWSTNLKRSMSLLMLGLGIAVLFFSFVWVNRRA
ncbi:D-alanyl-D-alanine carboxypeptidase DacF [Candidatus Rhabdochlamydia oedothoracis]|uniref:D-alanyl-D-alanine carboxypeptidase DacF n=1 Tax=Candidatus Rhabdochlamydia oedothoracis TaxID=2720720 RepID=A0ABX8V1A6_9BACT|nr:MULTISPECIES: D-alanyl-D-alanine carboxypeptidase family protein [Rhabdochlamydia]KAG6558864.1 D-alanyl-D-alanine carboxypeptidase DacF [Candidatus Rhabdochlamydia sp. W815]MCL6755717.1 D-alanyl-D-alanine carboxypeptidase [Candidatus Rhabdochlamydia oedothoracis]QYF48277.1 D-alanyl-D-alanine carboxypeptidase DacF [Candidatus Rhabdochlamydia oedothoracis]